MNKKAHHEKLDQIIDDMRKTAHQMLDSAFISDALTDDMINPDTYLLVKAIITIWSDKRQYAPLKKYKIDVENLSRFI